MATVEKGTKEKQNQDLTSTTAARLLFTNAIIQCATPATPYYNRETHRNEGQIIFVAMTHTGGEVPIDEETVLPVNKDDGPNHHTHDPKRGQATEEAKEQGDSPQKFGEDVNIDDGEGETHPGHRCNGSGKTVSAEPPQNLLGSVHKEDHAQYDSDDGECIRFATTPRTFTCANTA